LGFDQRQKVTGHGGTIAERRVIASVKWRGKRRYSECEDSGRADDGFPPDPKAAKASGGRFDHILLAKSVMQHLDPEDAACGRTLAADLRSG
jgi:hypothetical protein